MRKIILMLFLLFAAIFCYAADYRTIKSGDWQSTNTWSGGKVAPLTGGNNVEYIESNHDIVLNGDIDYGNNCILYVTGNLTINGKLIANNNLVINVLGTLIVNGDVVSKNGASIDISGSVAVSGNVTAQNNGNINLDNGVLNVSGSITSEGNSNITGTGTVYVGGDNSFNIPIGSNVIINPTLPVELINFESYHILDYVMIKWVTASEVNNDYFNIEMSYDATNWNTIGYISGNGTINEIMNYELKYYEVIESSAYFRLKQVDFDGKYKYYGPIFLKKDKDNHIQIMACCVTNSICIKSDFNNVKISLYGISGNVIMSKEIYNKESFLDISSLPRGMYIVTAEAGTTKTVKKIIKL